MRGKERKFFIISTVLLLLLMSPTVNALEIPEGFYDLEEQLSDSASDYLPEGVFSDDGQVSADALTEALDGKNILSLLSKMIKEELLFSLRLFAELCGLLLLSSVFGALCRSFSSDALSGVMRFCSGTVIFSSVIYMQQEHLRSVELFFGRLTALMTAMIPITGTVWAMGGNVATASTGTSALYILVGVCERVCAKSVVPVCCVFTALALCNTLSPEMGLRGLSGALRKIYTFTLGLIMTLLTASLSAQTTLTAAADSTAARAARLVSANIIPVVGGSVGETLRTVATGVRYLKSVVGLWGVVFVALMMLPILISLVLTRLVFLLGSGVAEMLGCEVEGRLLSELGGVYAIMVAVVAMSSVMFIFALTIFSKSVIAVL